MTFEKITSILQQKNKSCHLKLENYVEGQKTMLFSDIEFGDFLAIVSKVLYSTKEHPKRTSLKRKKSLKNIYGVEFFSQHKDFKNKITNTYLNRYGVFHNMKCPKLALKNAKSQNKYTETYHWKTGEVIGCIGSYERKTVDYLNNNRIEYKWQPVVINLGDTTYRPDLYLQDLDLWVEIKGYFRKDALDKWNMFKSIYPNSELWDEKYLKAKGIL